MANLIIGWLIIPAIGLYAPIHTAPIIDGMHQIGGGINHLDGTSWVLDQGGGGILAAHNTEWFKHLDDLQAGDRIIIITTNSAYEFKVNTMRMITRIDQINPTDTYILTLLTCQDRGVTWLVVNAKAVN